MTRMEIRAFHPGDWMLYRDARLAALQESPDAFGSPYALNAGFSDAVWRSRLDGLMPNEDFPIAAMVDDAVAGMAWVTIKADEPETAHLFQMWVAPSYRGQRLARQMLDAAIEWARRSGARRIALAVTLGASPARRLYESAGFEPDGEPEPLREGSALQVQPMARSLAGGL
jgi:GNAT superfamily N-acetyltransferase